MTSLRHHLLPEDAAENPYSQAVGLGDLVFVAGQLAQDDPDWSAPTGDVALETRRAMARIGRILAAAGCGFDDILRVGVFMTDLSQFEAMNAAYRAHFAGPRFPARTTVGVSHLLFGASVEIDCVARIP